MVPPRRLQDRNGLEFPPGSRRGHPPDDIRTGGFLVGGGPSRGGEKKAYPTPPGNLSGNDASRKARRLKPAFARNPRRNERNGWRLSSDHFCMRSSGPTSPIGASGPSPHSLRLFSPPCLGRVTSASFRLR